MKLITLILFCFTGQVILSQDTIIVTSGMYQIDHAKKLILINQGIEEINAQSPGNVSDIELNEIYSFQEIQNQFLVGEAYIANNSSDDSYKLYFTQLPIIKITTSDSIVDTPKVYAVFSMTESDHTFTTSDIGIEYRGGWSQTQPKKSLEIKFWEDPDGNETKDMSLLGLRNDDGWNLQAMYNEPLRFNNKTNFELWNKIDTLHYYEDEPDAINGVRMRYVEIFINDEYRGIYGLGEKVDRKQLKLKKHNGSIRGQLYKGDTWGATTFSSAPPFDNNSDTWGGFEYKHPDEEIDWTELHDFISFVINSNDADFNANYPSYFSIDNVVNYFIFVNIARLTDNLGKNLYVAKYNNNHPYFYVPWDLDGSFGTIWDGSNENITNDLLTNRFFNRLLKDCDENGFYRRLQNRWQELRNDVLTHQNITLLFMENHDYLQENGCFEREEIAWNDYSYPVNQLTYMDEWLTNRLNYLDSVFQKPCIGLSLENDIEFTTSVFPNPVSSTLNVQTTKNDFFIISNLLGEVIIKGEINIGKNTIEIEEITPGIYFLTTKSGNSQKFIKH